MSRPKMGELFAGYGGLGRGVQAVIDADLVWYADVCKFDKAGHAAGHHEPHRSPCAIMEHHHPGIPNHGDVAKVDWSAVEPVDILTGGSPCTDLSHAGKRGGMTEGTRSNLWVAMREAIAALRPSLVIWENVRGAYSAAADSEMEPCTGCLGGARDRGPSLRALGRVLGDLSELGYVGGWHGLRAADVGAPHGRFRVFVVAYTYSEGRSGLGWEHAARRDVDGRRGPHRLRPASEPTPLLPTPAVNDMGEGKTPDAWDEWTAKMQAAHGNGNGHGKSLAIEAQRLLPTPRAGDGESGGPNQRGSSGDLMLSSAVQPHRWGVYADAIARWEALTRPAPAPTQPSKKGTPQLSPAFSEFLMGLPEGHVTGVPGLSRNEQLKALGNGVVPAQAAAAVRFLLGGAAIPTPAADALMPTPQAADAKGVRVNTGGNPTLEGALVGYRPNDVKKHGRGSTGVGGAA